MKLNIERLLIFFEKQSDNFKLELLKYYNDYINKVSRRSWAISLECAVFLTVLCHYLKPDNILDLGSGFSSFVFRYYSSKIKKDYPTIYSIDTSNLWLEKSMHFCLDFNTNQDHFQNWEIFCEKSKNNFFKLIFIDIGLKERETYVKTIMKRFVDRNSVVILDDFHYDIFRKKVKEVLYDYNYNSYDIKNITLDSGGKKIRYCGMFDLIKRI